MDQPEVKQYWDQIAVEAQSLTALRLEKWRRTARNWLADYADKRAHDLIVKTVDSAVQDKKSSRVLDIGCGPGKWSTLFAGDFGSVTAIDVSPGMISLAKENAVRHSLGNIDFHVMDTSRLDFPDQSYDLVNCVTVLQHVFDGESWRNAVHEMVRVTRKGGHIVLFETAPHLTIKRVTHHLSVRTMGQYVQEFEKAGALLIHWRAADLSLPVTYLGLRSYASSFNKRVYYFTSRNALLPPVFLSFLSWAAARLAELIDFKLGETPLSFLSVGRIMLFRRTSSEGTLNSKLKPP